MIIQIIKIIKILNQVRLRLGLDCLNYDLSSIQIKLELRKPSPSSTCVMKMFVQILPNIKLGLGQVGSTRPSCTPKMI